jgi:RNA methyltransferase, TrmH family
VEGDKSVRELINSDYKIVEIFASDEWDFDHSDEVLANTISIASSQELGKLSFFDSSSPVIAISEIPSIDETNSTIKKWAIALDGINDPGNLGAIVRIADWYGINDIYCSKDTVDTFNPKSIAASMGSFTRVNVLHLDLEILLEQSTVPLYFCLMEGLPIHSINSPIPGVIVIGSEAHGIRETLLKIEHKAVTILGKGKTESLNAAIATGIVCDRLLQPLK